MRPLAAAATLVAAACLGLAAAAHAAARRAEAPGLVCFGSYPGQTWPLQRATWFAPDEQLATPCWPYPLVR